MPGPETTDSGGSRLARVLLGSAIGILAVLIAVLWVVELLDSVLLGDRLQRNGIHPRRTDGIDGIVWAPFLHSTWAHLVSNTIPFAVLGGLVAVRGRRRWLTVTLIVVFLGGGLTWLLAGGGNHIGASGVVFGYLGALVGAAIFERRPSSIAPALVAILLYGGIIVGFAPQRGVSWEGHLFGALAGLVAARILIEPTVPTAEPDDDELFDFGDFDPPA